MQIEVQCPSGLKGVFRGLKVKDEKLLTNRKLARDGRLITVLLNACWEKTIDPGPYNITSENFNWENAVAADRNYAILQLRIASYGKDYEFSLNCGDQNCKHRFGWTVDLTELEVQELVDAVRQHITTGEPIPVRGYDDQIIKCRLLNGADERYFAALDDKEQDSIMLHHLARQIVQLPNTEPVYKATVAAVEEMATIEADFLRDKLDSLAGGVETEILVECPRCLERQRVDLPFEASFFSKRKRFTRDHERNGTT